eukprot:8041931-Pyramimonas_sp.AAC.2
MRPVRLVVVRGYSRCERSRSSRSRRSSRRRVNNACGSSQSGGRVSLNNRANGCLIRARYSRKSSGYELYTYEPTLLLTRCDQHELVIKEEFRGQLPFSMLMRLLDRYDCRVEFKGGSAQFIAK